MNTLKQKIITIFLIAILLCTFYPLTDAKTSFASTEDVKAKVLILYDLDIEKSSHKISILDTLVGQFANQIEILSTDKFDDTQIDKFTHIVYYSEIEKQLPLRLTRAFNEYEGAIFAIGSNVQMLGNKFSFIKLHEENIMISRMDYLSSNVVEELSAIELIRSIEVDESVEVLATGTYKENSNIPFLVRQDDKYFCSTKSIAGPSGKMITQALASFFGKEQQKQIRYLRLEDVHPNSDPYLLREQAKYLAEKGIPYMIAVIPTYVHNDTLLHFSDAPRLVKTLKYMQENGASIVLHGYRHQYRGDETGEGYEFWDIEYDRPVYQASTETPLTEKDFSSEADYLNHIKEGEAFERTYTKSALSNGIHELVSHKLYPVAFEAPHYTMSKNGYKIVAEHFDAYVGKLQVTDKTSETSFVPLTVSQPTFLNGMTVYPETVGFIDEENYQNSFRILENNIKGNKQYDQAYIAGFYHPYLGLDGLKRVVEALEQAEGAEWLDLKEENLTVKMNDIRISTGDGQVVVEKPFIASTYERNVMLKSSIKWIILVVFVGPYVIFALNGLIRRRSSRAKAIRV